MSFGAAGAAGAAAAPFPAATAVPLAEAVASPANATVVPVAKAEALTVLGVWQASATEQASTEESPPPPQPISAIEMSVQIDNVYFILGFLLDRVWFERAAELLS